ncbi:hypothetical protein HZC31_02415 [Candidatus Woesearchaeota archaeon]|nr:hypothetical protein [Candidatus Woesearchaeota archaeon]
MTLENIFHALVVDSGIGLEQISRAPQLPHVQSARIPAGGVWQLLEMDCTLQYGNYAKDRSDGSEDLSVTLSHSAAYRALNPRARFNDYEFQLFLCAFECDELFRAPHGLMLEVFPPKNREMRTVLQSLLETQRVQFDTFYRTLGRKVPVEYRDHVSEQAAKTLLYTMLGVGQRLASVPEG